MTADRLPPFLVLAPYHRPPLLWGTEDWLLSDRPGCSSVVVGGPFDGARLTDLVDRFGAALTGARGLRSDGRLALLVKRLTTHDRLSVQVHPGHDDLPRLPAGAESKEEAWLVLDAKPGARLYLGTTPGCTREGLAAALADGSVEEHLDSYEPRVGDLIHVRPGTLHAIGAGLTLAEVQESSDTTYRVWDWGRTENGKPRALHVAEALAVTRFDRTLAQARVDQGSGGLPCGGHASPFELHRLARALRGRLTAPSDAFAGYVLLAGEARLPDAPDPVRAGHTVLVPPGGGADLVATKDGAFVRVGVA